MLDVEVFHLVQTIFYSVTTVFYHRFTAITILLLI